MRAANTINNGLFRPRRRCSCRTVVVSTSFALLLLLAAATRASSAASFHATAASCSSSNSAKGRKERGAVAFFRRKNDDTFSASSGTFDGNDAGGVVAVGAAQSSAPGTPILVGAQQGRARATTTTTSGTRRRALFATRLYATGETDEQESTALATAAPPPSKEDDSNNDEGVAEKKSFVKSLTKRLRYFKIKKKKKLSEGDEPLVRRASVTAEADAAAESDSSSKKLWKLAEKVVFDPIRTVRDKFLAAFEGGSTETVTAPGFGRGDGDETAPSASVEAAGSVAGATGAAKKAKIQGDRWSVSSVDLSGDWTLVVTDDFKAEYDKYLKQLGQPQLVRSIAVSIVGQTTEHTDQTDDGRELLIRGSNVRGVWERTLVASGADERSSKYRPVLSPIVSADGEEVESESWWECGGTKHRSWLRGVSKYGGGDFESLRYLTDDDVLVCESTFHPSDSKNKREAAKVTWRFKRQ